MMTSVPNTFDMTPWPRPRKIPHSSHPSRPLRLRENCKGQPRGTTKVKEVK